MRRYTLGISIFLAVMSASAQASDGVLEINQACAVNTGCFSGDTAGFPVTINGSAGRSYRLTSGLNARDADLTFIQINTNDVTVDLGGFRIACVAFSPPSTLAPCGDTGGTGSGISANSVTGVEVRNGSIVGMGFRGVSVSGGSVVRGLRLSENGEDGINCVSDCTISGNIVHKNGRHGIAGGVGSTVSGNTANGNGDTGVLSDIGSTISGNTANGNGGAGITAAVGSTISGNTASDNGRDGIVALPGSNVRGNTVRQNLGVGLSLDATAAYSENAVSGNASGTVGGGNNRGGNYCACPSPQVCSATCP